MLATPSMDIPEDVIPTKYKVHIRNVILNCINNSLLSIRHKSTCSLLQERKPSSA